MSTLTRSVFPEKTFLLHYPHASTEIQKRANSAKHGRWSQLYNIYIAQIPQAGKSQPRVFLGTGQFSWKTYAKRSQKETTPLLACPSGLGV